MPFFSANSSTILSDFIPVIAPINIFPSILKSLGACIEIFSNILKQQINLFHKIFDYIFF